MAKKGHKKKRAPSPVAKKNRYHGAAIAAPVPPSFPDVRREEGHLVPKAIISKKAWSKITEVVDMDTGRECGALLIGNILRDRVTGMTIALVDDAYSDGEHGGTSDYRFTAALQAQCVNYVYREYGEEKHVIGTVHSHGNHDAFFSSVDYRMMTSRRSEELHMVLSPSHGTYVVTFKDLENNFVDADLDVSAIMNSFRYRRDDD